MSDDERSEDHQKQGRPSVISAKTVNTSVKVEISQWKWCGRQSAAGAAMLFSGTSSMMVLN